MNINHSKKFVIGKQEVLPDIWFALTQMKAPQAITLTSYQLPTDTGALPLCQTVVRAQIYTLVGGELVTSAEKWRLYSAIGANNVRNGKYHIERTEDGRKTCMAGTYSPHEVRGALFDLMEERYGKEAYLPGFNVLRDAVVPLVPMPEIGVAFQDVPPPAVPYQSAPVLYDEKGQELPQDEESYIVDDGDFHHAFLVDRHPHKVFATFSPLQASHLSKDSSQKLLVFSRAKDKSFQFNLVWVDAISLWHVKGTLIFRRELTQALKSGARWYEKQVNKTMR